MPFTPLHMGPDFLIKSKSQFGHTMLSVFILEHLHIHKDGEECWKRIGVYTNYEEALFAIDRIKLQPGFSDYPNLIDSGNPPCTNGFNIGEYKLNQDHWQEGYITVE